MEKRAKLRQEEEAVSRAYGCASVLKHALGYGVTSVHEHAYGYAVASVRERALGYGRVNIVNGKRKRVRLQCARDASFFHEGTLKAQNPQKAFLLYCLRQEILGEIL